MHLTILYLLLVSLINSRTEYPALYAVLLAIRTLGCEGVRTGMALNEK